MLLKRKKRRAKGPSRLSFVDDVDGETDEEDNGGNGMNLTLLQWIRLKSTKHTKA